MRVLERDYVRAGLPTMESYFNSLMEGTTGEDLASVLECSVDDLYEMLRGVREITPEEIAALHSNPTYQPFLVGCQMMRTITTNQ